MNLNLNIYNLKDDNDILISSIGDKEEQFTVKVIRIGGSHEGC